MFLVFQGVRSGEVRAVKVKGIDFKKGHITIARTFSSGKVRERVKGTIEKTRLINPILLDLAAEHCRDRHPEETLTWPCRYQDDNGLAFIMLLNKVLPAVPVRT